MSIIFRYIHVQRPDGTLKKAPYIPVFLRNKENKLIKFAGLLDSGADNTIVPEDLAKVLGLKEEKNSDDETKGIGGKVKTSKSTLQLRIKNGRENYPLKLPVLILKDKHSDVPLLLGRQGFFENFDITFRQNEEKIILKKISPK